MESTSTLAVWRMSALPVSFFLGTVAPESLAIAGTELVVFPSGLEVTPGTPPHGWLITATKKKWNEGQKEKNQQRPEPPP
jgi:hypothetical protein